MAAPSALELALMRGLQLQADHNFAVFDALLVLGEAQAMKHEDLVAAVKKVNAAQKELIGLLTELLAAHHTDPP